MLHLDQISCCQCIVKQGWWVLVLFFNYANVPLSLKTMILDILKVSFTCHMNIH
jgi:hypothetical protein